MHRAEDWGVREEDHEQRVRSLEFLDPTSRPTTAALLTDFAFENLGDEIVAADTWELVTPGDGSRYFTESWISDDDGWGVFYDGDDSFLNNDFAHYVGYASLQFEGPANGDTIGVGIQFAASSSFFHPNLIVVRGGINRVLVAAPWWSTLEHCRLYAYTSAARGISTAEFVIRKFELNASGTIGSRP